MTDGAPASTAPSRTGRVWGLSVALALGAAALNAVVAGGSAPTGDWIAQLAALVPLFVLTEVAVVHVTVGRDAHTVAFAELPFVLGLYLCAPGAVLAARVVAVAGVCVYDRHQPIVKLMFNVAQAWFSGVAALSVWLLLSGPNHRYDVRGFAAAVAGAMVLEATSSGAVTAVIAARGGAAAVRPATLVTGLAAAGANGCFALIALVVAHTDWRGLWVVAVVAAFLVLAHRAHMALLRRHDAIERLNRFTARIGGGDLHLDAVVSEVLRGVRDLLEVTVARLDLEAGPQAPSVAWLCDADGVHPAPPAHRVLPAPAAPLPRRGSRLESLTVPLDADAGSIGAITVSGRLSEVGGLVQSDLRLLEAVARHATVALHNGALADRLRQQVSANEYQALHDSLTGLPNRLMFDRATSAALSSSTSCAVVLLDIDRFKEINDTLGHAAGDAFLQQVGERVSAVVPAGTCVARLGGDEFAVVLTGAGLREATDCAAAIQRALVPPLHVVGVTLTAEASVGIALASGHGDDTATLLRRADVAMYEAKDAHAGVAVYAPDRDHHSAARLTLVADLRAAIAEGQLFLAYQPKTGTGTRTVHGVEALVRWRHPSRGLIPPDDFIGIAEQTGLIAPLTDWVLRTALSQCRRWLEDGLDLSVAVNISPRTLLDPSFPGHLSALLADARVPAARLTLEITEGALMADPERAIDVLWGLRRGGVRLSVDDLGVGHSSLSYLKRLPVHEIKIDKSFVTGMVDDSDDEAIVMAIIAMVHKLRMAVVAEGVEDERTLVRLADLGADIAQGYWMSRPLPASEVAPWIRSWTADLPTSVVVPMHRVAR